MQRLKNGVGGSPLISIRLVQQTVDRLDALVANLRPHPVVGALPRSSVLRAVIDAGIEAIATREGIQIGTAKPNEKAARKTRASKTPDAKTVHPRSRAMAETRAAARRAAG